MSARNVNLAAADADARPERRLDAVRLALIRGALEQIVEEMDVTHSRAAFSPLVSEGGDRANGIFEYPTGNTVAQGATGLPIFIGAMAAAVASTSRHLSTRGVQPGDVYVLNDPYLGGTHLQDVKLVAPYYAPALPDPMFFLANTTHWMDVGGSVPGGFAPRSTEIFQEGLRILPTCLVRAGELNEDLSELLLGNVRVPGDIRGDLAAALAALEVGKARLDDLVAKYGRGPLLEAVRDLEEASERQMRSYITEIPDGTYEAEDVLDSDGIVDELVHIRLSLTVQNTEIHFAFGKSDPPRKGPVNLPLPTTIAACHVALKHVFPDVPINAGCFRPLSFDVPDTTFLNVQHPRPVSGYFESSSRVADVVWQALAQAMPDRLFASAFSTAGPMMIAMRAQASDHTPGRYQNHGRLTVVNYSGGYGATARTDGLSGACPPLSVGTLAPLEIYEHRAPIEFTRYGLRQDSGGAGRQRGGLGSAMEFVFLGETGAMSTIADRGRRGPPGIAGGHDGACTEIRIERADGQVYVPKHTTKDQDVPISRGDRIVLRTPGGGGHGEPLARDAIDVQRDVERGYVSSEAADRLYRR